MKIQKGNVASVTASYQLGRMIAMNEKHFNERNFIKQLKSLEKTHLFIVIYSIRKIVAELIDEMSGDVKQRLKAVSSKFTIFQFLLIGPLTSLTIFIRICDSEFDIYEELTELVPMHVIETNQRIFEKFEQVLHVYCTLSYLSTDSTVIIAGRYSAIAAKWQTKIKKTNQIHHLLIFTVLFNSKIRVQRF